MARSFSSVRRWLGGVYLLIAVLMLVAGVTILKDRLQGVYFIYYWLICTLLTFLTLMIAILDFRSVRRSLRREQGELLQDTLRAIEAEQTRVATKAQKKI